MPAPTPVIVNAAQRRQLEAMAAGENSRLATRARIILRLSDGARAQAVAADLGVSLPSISQWRVRWKRNGLHGLHDAPGRGRKPGTVWERKASASSDTTAGNDTGRAGEIVATPVTMEAIAQRAKVSVSTVSRTLGNRGGVGAATAKRIRALARTLGYRPDPMLSALIAYQGRVRKAGDHGTLALISARGKDEARFPEYLRLQVEGMRKACGRLGYNLEIFEVDPDTKSHRRVSRMLYSRGIRGVLVGSIPVNWSGVDLQWDHFSAVAIGRSLRSPLLHRVSPNHYAAVEILYRRMRDLGYRRIGFCDRRLSEQNMDFINLSVYLRCLYLDGLGSDALPPYLFETIETLDPEPWLERHGIDAVICGWGDSIRRKLKGSRFKIPARLGLADLSAPIADLDLSGMVQNERAIGEAAVHMLHGHLLQNRRGVPSSAERQTIMIDATWRPGKTLRRQ